MSPELTAYIRSLKPRQVADAYKHYLATEREEYVSFTTWQRVWASGHVKVEKINSLQLEEAKEVFGEK